MKLDAVSVRTVEVKFKRRNIESRRPKTFRGQYAFSTRNPHNAYRIHLLISAFLKTRSISYLPVVPQSLLSSGANADFVML